MASATVESRQLQVIDTRTGRRGTTEDWVARFAELWAAGASSLDGLMSLLSAHVRLAAPGLEPTTGQADGRAAFARTFEALPDLTARVVSWAARGDVLFIELVFGATIGGRRIEWPAVDRFRFEDGEAVERSIHFDRTPIRKAYMQSLSGLRQLWRLRHVRARR